MTYQVSNFSNKINKIFFQKTSKIENSHINFNKNNKEFHYFPYVNSVIITLNPKRSKIKLIPLEHKH